MQQHDMTERERLRARLRASLVNTGAPPATRLSPRYDEPVDRSLPLRPEREGGRYPAPPPLSRYGDGEFRALPAPVAPDMGDIHHVMPGFWQDTPFGRVFVVERRFELEHRHGRLPLGRLLSTPTDLWARIGRAPELAGIDPRRAVFLDTETTGLAGGSGTAAFLIGIGHFLDGHFRMRQYFMGGLDQERAMLRALVDYLDGFEAIVTFNGKTFDLPLLETRLVMTRFHHTTVNRLTSLPHLDLLHPARRLYRDRFASCRLGELEARVLGLTREEDISGAEIPALFFRYLREGRFRSLVRIFDHNLLDVLSLVTLADHLARLFGGDARLTGQDRLALAKTCEAEARLEEAVVHYEAALEAALREVERDECEKRLSLLYKKLGRWDEAVHLWEEVARRSGNHNLYPLVELSKYRERVTRDFDGARAAAERALLLLDGYHARMGYSTTAAERTELQKRIGRLDERAARTRLAAARPRRPRRSDVVDGAIAAD